MKLVLSDKLEIAEVIVPTCCYIVHAYADPGCRILPVRMKALGIACVIK